MKCKYFKTRKKDNKRERRIYNYCSLLRKETTHFKCHECVNKEYKQCTALKKRTGKQAKKEKNRFSIFTDDLEHCIICGLPNVNKHEIFGGRNRTNSIKYGLVIPLCTKRHHNQIEKKGIHFDEILKQEWHKKGQTKFNEVYPDLNFIDIFFRNYLK